MLGVVAVSLVVLVGLLFYKFVERRHKIWLAKLLLGLAGLAVATLLVAFGIDWRAKSREEALKRSVSVRLAPDSGRILSFDELVARGAGPTRPNSASDRQTINLWKEYSGSPDTLSSVTFELCNRGQRTIRRVTFMPVSFDRGRSTAHDLRVRSSRSTSVSNVFDSDHIMGPGECKHLTWGNGIFVVRDSVQATVLTVDAERQE